MPTSKPLNRLLQEHARRLREEHERRVTSIAARTSKRGSKASSTKPALPEKE